MLAVRIWGLTVVPLVALWALARAKAKAEASEANAEKRMMEVRTRVSGVNKGWRW